METFLYRDFGKEIIKRFSKVDESVLLFLIDISDLFDPRNFLTIIAWRVIIYLKTEKKSIQVVNKADLVPKEKLTELKIRLKTFKIFDELEKGDAFDELIARNFRDFYEYSTIFVRPLFISAKKEVGIENLISFIYDLACTCGDLM